MSKTGTRRLSAGFMTAGPFSTSDNNECDFADLSFLRRNSCATRRALMCPVGSEGSASRDSLRSIVVTPDSIPQFTIPKLALEERHSAKERKTQPGKDTAWKPTEGLNEPLHPPSSSSVSSSSSSSLFSSSPAVERKAQRSISDPADNHRQTSVRCSPCTFMERDQCSDPATRGALSLPHLAKITTPYGFVTLSQSPQIANEEELLRRKGYRSWARDQKNMSLRNLRVETKSSSSGRMVPVQSHTDADSHHISRQINNPETDISSGSVPSPVTTRRPKQSFWGVLCKHLSTRQLTSI